MGKSESSSIYIGIKILISHLIEQLNESNFVLIKKLLQDGFIDYDNGFFNENYIKIEKEFKIQDIEKFKNNIMNILKTNGDIAKSKFSSETKNDLSRGTLYEQTLLIPIERIMKTERWGYDRYGTNGTYRKLDFDIEIIKNKIYDEYKNKINDFEIVMILEQFSG
jgi:hypothetical protein